MFPHGEMALDQSHQLIDFRRDNRERFIKVSIRLFPVIPKSPGSAKLAPVLSLWWIGDFSSRLGVTRKNR